MNSKKIIISLSFIILILSLNALYATDDNATENALTQQYSTIGSDTQFSAAHQQLKQASDTVYVDSKSNTSTEDGTKDAPYRQINDETIAKIS